MYLVVVGFFFSEIFCDFFVHFLIFWRFFSCLIETQAKKELIWFQASFRIFLFWFFVRSLHFKNRQGEDFFSFFGNSKIDAFSNLLNIVVDFSLIIKFLQESIFDLKMRHKFLLHFFSAQYYFFSFFWPLRFFFYLVFQVGMVFLLIFFLS